MDSLQHHKHKGNLYQFRIDLYVPRKELMVRKLPGGEAHAYENPYTAANFTFKAANYMLKKYADKLHQKVKSHTEPLRGEIINLGKNFGHIKLSNNIFSPSIYFHENAFLEGKFEDLKLEIQFILL